MSKVVWSKTYCGFCTRLLSVLADLNPRFPSIVIQLDEETWGTDVQAELLKLTGSMTVPQLFVNGTYIGGCTESLELHSQGKLQPAIAEAVAAHNGASGASDAAPAAIATAVEENGEGEGEAEAGSDQGSAVV